MMSAGASNGSGPCGACKFLRRKCVRGCIFAPYFDPDQGTAHFAAVHKVFGASNASKLLLRIPAPKRPDAVVTLSYEALARVRDPVYGCVGHIFALQTAGKYFSLDENRPYLSNLIFSGYVELGFLMIMVYFLPLFHSKLARNVRWWPMIYIYDKSLVPVLFH
ncbi:hypothetical protein OIU78_011760 [Salix suchowensis]|nr:hypothetical protein OIU78_011760 [Salix suchowensis]